ncbi:endonuclease/exonuclease/phosphatase family protein [Roseobacter sinensis]|uniref:Endonuclease/exonuclease/phosphatase family protein n=1 Tax=Roseobacter sinensis TaxID=2931391 RepID=A0ABT3BL44_9RHOB|nr:endonuclease/exonuclease/phosphatase family protein [Roseobacter sp. WL0113]MCV3274287.1 endonuclease/exonuclease/phosphatase family protein [Roseobacter sp. WL0113]
MLASLAAAFGGSAVGAESLRVATFNTELSRKGPGLLLRDISRGEDPQVRATLAVIAAAAPDVLLLQGFDYDLTGAALAAYMAALEKEGLDYTYSFSARPNTGMPTGLDMDGNGKLGEPRDAQSYGRFSGQGGMAILSRYPIDVGAVKDFTDLLWRDLPGALLPETADGPFPSAEAQAAQRLSTTNHWVVPIEVPALGTVDILAFQGSPPVFDGPEDRNGKRNHDETVFWQHYLAGHFGEADTHSFVLLGDINQDRRDGEGIKSAISALLDDPRLQDPLPRSAGSEHATGDPFDTVDWTDPVPGNLRVDYVLPSADWQVLDTGVLWPIPEDPLGQTVIAASRHRLVWVDIAR